MQLRRWNKGKEKCTDRSRYWRKLPSLSKRHKAGWQIDCERSQHMSKLCNLQSMKRWNASAFQPDCSCRAMYLNNMNSIQDIIPEQGSFSQITQSKIQIYHTRTWLIKLHLKLTGNSNDSSVFYLANFQFTHQFNVSSSCQINAYLASCFKRAFCC